MAIYHLSAQIISRKAGRSSTAAAAYRSGERIVDERTGEIHDYRRKGGVSHTEIVMPSGSDWAPTRSELWNAVEAKNKRADSQVAREFLVALPDELNESQRRELAMAFARELADKYQIAVDVAIHAPGKGDQRNHHAHILTSTNKVQGHGFGNKARELDFVAHNMAGKVGQANEIDLVRERWEQLANQALEKAGQEARIDHRSLESQGITDRMPGVHLGPTATTIERSGRESDIGRRAREQADQFMADMQAQVALQRAAERDVAELETALATARWQATPVEDRLKVAKEAHQQLLQERSALWKRQEQADEAAKRARPMAEVQKAVQAIPAVVKRAKAAREEVAQLRQAEQQLHWWSWLQRRRLAKELPAAIERADNLVAKAKGLDELARSPVREKVEEAQAQLKTDRQDFDGRFEAVVSQVVELETVQKAQEARQAELQRAADRQRAIEAAEAASRAASAHIERQQARPKERSRQRDYDDGPSLG